MIDFLAPTPYSDLPQTQLLTVTKELAVDAQPSPQTRAQQGTCSPNLPSEHLHPERVRVQISMPAISEAQVPYSP